MTWVTLATEDAVSEAVGERLIAEHGKVLFIGQRLGRRGFGYLRSAMPKFREMARRQPVIVLTDLDRASCAASLVTDWIGTGAKPQNLMLRVAVREVESWILADHDAVRSLLATPRLPLPEKPDDLDDPKALLLKLAAERAPRQVREALVPVKGAIASQGLGYNAMLTNLVAEHWNPERAAQRSDSLHRARLRLRELSRSGGAVEHRG